MHHHLLAASDALVAATRDLPPEVVGRAAAGGRWSIAQILEHLTLAFRGHADAVARALASGEVRASPPALKQRLGRLLVVDLGYFPRVEAPERTKPTGTVPVERAASSAIESLAALDSALARAAAAFGETRLVSNHPYFGGMSVRQWRKFHWRHTTHHVKQIDKLRIKN